MTVFLTFFKKVDECIYIPLLCIYCFVKNNMPSARLLSILSVVMLVFASFGIVSASFEIVSDVGFFMDSADPLEDNETEYWALMVAVGVYKNNPDMDRPTMLTEIEHLKDTLLGSSLWAEDHIKVITGEDAMLKTVLDGFSWLEENEDSDDVCLVFLTSHGFPIGFDRPPFDEEDHKDEALAMYNGFLPFPNPFRWEPLANPFAVLTDDMVNNRLNNLESKSVCCIVDSCHSGGFGDYWESFDELESYDFGFEFAADVADQNRVVITSVPETEVSYGSFLTNMLSQGLVGFADANDDGFCSAEEAYEYAEPIIRSYTSMRPQIFDNHPGELILTRSNLPPVDFNVSGPSVVDAKVSVDFTVSAFDPEGGLVNFFVDWGDESGEYTDWVSSGESVILSHSYEEEGVYDLSFSAFDESGREAFFSLKSIAVQDTHLVDQRSMWNENGSFFADILSSEVWYAQSFSPSLADLSSVYLCFYASPGPHEVSVEIWDDINGSIIASSVESIVVEDYDEEEYFEIGWYEFSFDELSLDTSDQYYLVLRGSDELYNAVFWICTQNRGTDVYENGELLVSVDGGLNWHLYNDFGAGFYDALFVTYGL